MVAHLLSSRQLSTGSLMQCWGWLTKMAITMPSTGLTLAPDLYGKYVYLWEEQSQPRPQVLLPVPMMELACMWLKAERQLEDWHVLAVYAKWTLVAGRSFGKIVYPAR